MPLKLRTVLCGLDEDVRKYLRDYGAQLAAGRVMTAKQRARHRAFVTRTTKLITDIEALPLTDTGRDKLLRDALVIRRLLLTEPPSADELARVEEQAARMRGRSPDRRPLFAPARGTVREVSGGLPGLGRRH